MTAISDFPSPPAGVVELLEQILAPEPDLRVAATCINRIPALRERMLALARRGDFGVEVEAATLDQFLEGLDAELLRGKVLPIAFWGCLLESTLGDGIDLKALCRHSVATAVVMQVCARSLGLKDREPLYTLGLIHDLGKVVLDALPGPNYRAVFEQDGMEDSLFEVEQRLFGRNNREAWLITARRWRFPAMIVERYQGWVEGRVSHTVWDFAESASRVADTLGCYLFPKPSGNALSNDLGLLTYIREKGLIELSRRVQDELRLYREALAIPAPDVPWVSSMLFRIVRELSEANMRFERSDCVLTYRVTDLEMLAKVFAGIIKSLEGDTLTFSVLESIMEGFRSDGAFMLNHDGHDGYVGYAAWTDHGGQPMIDFVQLVEDQLSQSIKACIEIKRPLQIEDPVSEPLLQEYLGDVHEAWLVPACVQGRVAALIGIGFNEARSLEVGATFGATLEILAGEVALSVENTQLYHQMHKDANTDHLTGISNRRNILQVLKSEFARFKRKGSPLTAAVFDMDYFKTVNDRLGHVTGDEVLVKMARILKEWARESDYVGRYGGDEFLAVFPYTTAKDAMAVVERIRVRLARFCAELDCLDIGKPLSVSVGLAEADQEMNSWDDLINQADDALYHAKDKGRNRCVCYGDDAVQKT